MKSAKGRAKVAAELTSLFRDEDAHLGKFRRIKEEHTPSGRHVNREVPFPDWVPAEVAAQAREIGEQEALDALSTHRQGEVTPMERVNASRGSDDRQ